MRFGWPFFEVKSSLEEVVHRGLFSSHQSVRATYRLPLDPERFRERIAIGIASSRPYAECLCCMHALKILRALRVDQEFCNANKNVPSPPALCLLNENLGARNSIGEDEADEADDLTNKVSGQKLQNSRQKGSTFGSTHNKVETIIEEDKKLANLTEDGKKGEIRPAFVPINWRKETDDGYALVRSVTSVTSPFALVRYTEIDERSKIRMRDFLRFQRQTLSQVFVPSQLSLVDPKNTAYSRLYFRCTGHIYINDVGSLIPIGESYNAEDALILACMHAEILIDHVGGQFFPTKPELQTKRAEITKKSGRWAPLPHELTRPLAKANLPPPLRRRTQETTSVSFNALVAKKEELEEEGKYEIVSREAYRNKYLVGLKQYFLFHSKENLQGRQNPSHLIKCVRIYVDEGHRQHRAVLELPVPSSFGKRLAVGFATTSEDAKLMCILHATRILDKLHFSVFPDSPEMQVEHRKESISAGRVVASPFVPLAPFSTPSPPPVKLKRYGLATKPTLTSEEEMKLDYNSWFFFVQQVKIYLECLQEATDYEYLRKGMVPRTGDPIVDVALDIVEGDRFSTSGTKNTLSDWCEYSGNPYPKEMGTRILHDTPYVHTYFPVPGYPEYTAHGIHRLRPESARRAIAHAVYMLRTLDKDFAEGVRGRELYKSSSVLNWDAEAGELTPEGQTHALNIYQTITRASAPQILVKFDKESNIYNLRLRFNDPKAGIFDISENHGTRNGALFQARSKLISALILRRDSTSADLSVIVHTLQRFIHLDSSQLPSLSSPFYDDSTLQDRINEALWPLKDMEDLKRESEQLIAEELHARLHFRETSLRPFRKEMRLQLHERINSASYQSGIGAQRAALSIASIREEILETVKKNQITIICAAAGSGKTTQIPQYILDDAIENEQPCCLAVTQPRRISAVSVAKRVAEERGEEVGKSIGYIVRLEHLSGSHITYQTSGILLRKLQSDRYLHKLSHVIFDEVHDRDMSTDILLMLVRDFLSVRKDIKVIIMSATMHAETYTQYFENAPVLNCTKGMYDVEIRHLDFIATVARERKFVSTSLLNLSPPPELLNPGKRPAGMVKANTTVDFRLLGFLLSYVLENHDVEEYSILVFLPGWSDIVAAQELLTHLQHKIDIFPLHSSIPHAQQLQVFTPARPGKTKVVLSTTIGESAITIADVRVVIDTGRIKETVMSYDEEGTTYQTTLQVMHTSQANCIQRAGRAGRTQRGICYRMFTRDHYQLLTPFPSPQLTRTPLDEIYLLLLTFGIKNPENYLRHKTLDPPTTDAIHSAMRKLQETGAMDEEGKVTPLGLYLSPLPLNPQTGKMVLLGLALGCLDTALTLATVLSVNPFDSSSETREGVRLNREIIARKTRSDLLALVNAYNAWINIHKKFPQHEPNFCREHNLSCLKLKQISMIKHQLHSLLGDSGYLKEKDNVSARDIFSDCSYHSTLSNEVIIAKGLIACMLYPNVAVKTRRGHRTKHFEVLLEPTSVCAQLLEYIQKSNEHELPPYYLYRLCSRNLPTARDLANYKVTEVTNLSIWPLLLFGVPQSSMEYIEKVRLLIIDQWLFVLVDPETFKIVQTMKVALNLALIRKLRNPDNVDAREDLRRVQRAFVELLRAADQAGPFTEEGTVTRLGEDVEWAKLDK